MSGRRVEPPSELSNIGLIVRLMDPDTAMKVFNEITDKIKTINSPIIEPIRLLLQPSENSELNIKNLYGSTLYGYLVEGLEILMAYYGEDKFKKAIVYAPLVEGVGFYPQIDSGLKYVENNIWIAGDATGLFRGLAQALISGYFTGLRCLKILKK